MHKRKERLFFLKKLIKNPKAVGAIAPSSQNLGDFISRFVQGDINQTIIELGAGTGSLTKALLKAGIEPQNLILVELDGDMCRMLQDKFPLCQVLHGSADKLDALIDASLHGQIRTIISGIPMVNLSTAEKQAIITASMRVLAVDGQFLQFTYGPVSPLPAKKLGLKQKRLGHVLLNMPPATVWRYSNHDLTVKEPRKSPRSFEEKIRRIVALRRRAAGRLFK